MKIVLVGYGAIAKRHLEVFRELGANVAASCNRSDDGNRKARYEGGIGTTYTDVRTMVECEKPDGILICASFKSLYELALNIIPYGLPTLLEKPPGLSVKQTQKLTDLANRHKTQVMVGLNRRFYSIYHKALDFMRGKERVTSVSVEWSEDAIKMLRNGYSREDVSAFIYANSLHGIDLVGFFAGEISDSTIWGRNLDADKSSFRWQMAMDGVADGGARIHFDSNWDVPGRWRLVVDAENVRFVSMPLEKGDLFIREEGVRSLEPSEQDRVFKPGFYGQAKYFLRLINDGRRIEWPAASLQESVQAMTLASEMTSRCIGSHG